jgi:hypothetical protein
MRSFLRENPTIAFGLGLPLLLVVVFLLVSGIPVLLVDPPRYDVLYATEYENYPGSGLQVSVVEGKVRVVYQGNTQGYRKPRVWRYSPANGGVKEIPVLLPAGLAPPGTRPAVPETPAVVTPIEVPELAGLTVDSSSVAPDGYEFNVGRNGYSGDVFTGLFYPSRYRSEAVLTKQGRSFRLPNMGNVYYSNNTHFIGWVVAP